MNIVIVHATQRARGVTIRTKPKMVRRMLGTVHMATVLLTLLIQTMKIWRIHKYPQYCGTPSTLELQINESTVLC